MQMWRSILAKQQRKVSLPDMFVRLTRRNRTKAGWLVALLYLFCVLAPGVALALGNSAPCLPNVGTTSVHSEHSATAHDHATMHDHAAHADAAPHEHKQHRHDGKTSPGPCCAMLCLSALAADLPAIEKPAQPSAIRVAEIARRLHGTTPPLLDRPPNA
jgi:hypothetical protein